VAIRVVDASRLYDESDSEAPFAHQTSLILSDARWLRIAGPTAVGRDREVCRQRVGGCRCSREGEEQTSSSGFSGRWRYWRTATRSSGIERGPCGPARRVSLALSRSSEPPPGSTTLDPGRPAAHLGKFGDRVREIRPIVLTRGRLLLLGKGAVLAHRFDRPLAGESDD
jgi:hypothetical protein